MRDPLSRLSRNAFHNLSALVLPAMLAVVTTPFIVRRLGDERFGLYMLTLSVVGFGGLLDLGLATAGVKFVSEEYARKDVRALSGVLNSLLASRVVLGSLASLIGLVGAPFLCIRLLAVAPHLIPEAVFVLRLASLSVGVGMIVGTLASLPRAAHRFDITSRITLVASLTLTLLTVGIVGVGRGIREIAAAELTVTALQLPVYWRVCRGLFPEWGFRLWIDKSWLRRLLGFGGLAALGNLTAIVFVHVNRILVGRFLGTAAVTYFTVPWSITARLTHLVYALAEVVAPLASSLSASDAGEQLERLHRRVSKVALLICGTIAVPLFLTAPDLLGLWMGPTFGERGGNVLRLLAVSVMLQSQAMVTYLLLTGMGRAAAANFPAVLGAFVNLLVALLVGPRFGLVGLAAAVLMGVGVQLILLELCVGRAFRWRSIATVEARQVAASAVGAIVVGMSVAQILGNPWTRLAVLALVGVASFHGLLAAFGAYSRPEREVLLRQIRSVLPVAGPGAARRSTPETDRPDRPPSGPPSA